MKFFTRIHDRIGPYSDIILFIALSLCILFYRIHILDKFGFVYTDSDQSIMWMGAKNFSEGQFHEPRFYGQNYNTMLEALLAVPLIKAGISYHKALPIITSLLTLLPFFAIAILTYRKRSKFVGVLLLTMPLLLPTEFDLLTSTSRGFVTGLSVACFCCMALFYPASKRWFCIAGFCMMLGYSINANSILLSVPCMFLLWLYNYRSTKFYVLAACGFSIALLIHLWAAHFYTTHPNYVLHSFMSFYSFGNLKDGLNDLDKFFNYLTPVFSKNGWMSLGFFAIISIVLFIQKKKKEAFTVFIIPLLILLPLCSSKIHDGTDSVFFPYSRMYLSVPILLILSISFLTITKNRWGYFYLGFVALYFIVKINGTHDVIRQGMKKYHVIGVVDVETLQRECKQLSNISKKYDVDIIVINHHWSHDLYNYACATCEEQFPETIYPNYERRTWKLMEYKNTVYNTVMVIDIERRLDKEFDFISLAEGEKDFYIIKDNKIPTIELLEKLKFDVREF